MLTKQQIEDYMPSRAVAVLHLVRKTHDTTDMTADRFEDFAKAVIFYLRGGFSIQDTASLVIQDYWRNMRRVK